MARASRFELRSSPRLLAPDWTKRVRAIPAWGALALLVVVVASIAYDPNAIRWMVAVLAVIAAVAGPIALKLLNTRIVVTHEMVECRDALRRVTRCPRDELARLVTVRIRLTGIGSVLTRILMLDQSGRARLNLQWDAWSDEQLVQITERLGLPATDLPEPLSTKEVNRQFPGGASAALRHWPLVALASGVAVLVLAAVVIVGLQRI